jgi:hypothetical protein
MYRLYPLGSGRHDPEALWLSYEWDDSFVNLEWRQCVQQFLEELKMLGHEVTPLSIPPFTPGEDSVQVTYLVDKVETTFTSDHLLSLITVHSKDPSVLHRAWREIGNKVGWERQ